MDGTRSDIVSSSRSATMRSTLNEAEAGMSDGGGLGVGSGAIVEPDGMEGVTTAWAVSVGSCVDVVIVFLEVWEMPGVVGIWSGIQGMRPFFKSCLALIASLEL
jgi:hypothetical protein